MKEPLLRIAKRPLYVIALLLLLLLFFLALTQNEEKPPQKRAHHEAHAQNQHTPPLLPSLVRCLPPPSHLYPSSSPLETTSSSPGKPKVQSPLAHLFARKDPLSLQKATMEELEGKELAQKKARQVRAFYNQLTSLNCDLPSDALLSCELLPLAKEGEELESPSVLASFSLSLRDEGERPPIAKSLLSTLALRGLGARELVDVTAWIDAATGEICALESATTFSPKGLLQSKKELQWLLTQLQEELDEENLQATALSKELGNRRRRFGPWLLIPSALVFELR